MLDQGKQLLFLFQIIGLLFGCTSYKQGHSSPHHFDTLYSRAISYKNINTDTVQLYLTQAYKIADSLKNPHHQITSLLELAVNDAKSGSYSNGITNCFRAKDIINQNGLIEFEGKVLIKIGAIYQMMGLTSEALQFYLEALEFINTMEALDVAALYYHIASAYDDLKAIDKCQKYARMSIQTSKDIDYIQGEFNSYSLLANTFYTIDSIQKYLDLSIQITKDNPLLTYEKVTILNNIALFEKALGNYAKSDSIYLEAITIAKNNGFNYYLSNLYNNYAYLLMAQNNFDSAEIALKKALKIVKAHEDLDLEGSIYDSYSDYYKRIGNYRKAYYYKDTSIQKKKLYRSRQRVQKSMFLSTVFETENQQMEILEQKSKINRMQSIIFASIAIIITFIGVIIYFLQKTAHNKTRLEKINKEKELDVANALIEGEDNERKRLARDLHDGISAQIGALRLFVEAYFNTEQKCSEVLETIDDIRGNIRNLSHKMLPTQIEELGLVKSLKNIFVSANYSKEYKVVLETNIKQSLGQKLEVNLYYLIYELINNAIKHSKGSCITVQLFNDNGNIQLSVEDDGIGFDPHKVKKGLGLMNIDYRVKHMGGKINIESRENSGTLFIIEIPVNI